MRKNFSGNFCKYHSEKGEKIRELWIFTVRNKELKPSKNLWTANPWTAKPWRERTSCTEADGAQSYFKIIISTIDAAPGTARVPNCHEETIQFNVLGFWCNHMVLELLQAKILPKRARDHQKSQNFWGFWPPAALKPRGCTRNLGNWMVWILPDILVPLLFWGLRQ